jgi:hypothetical protein
MMTLVIRVIGLSRSARRIRSGALGGVMGANDTRVTAGRNPEKENRRVRSAAAMQE